MPITNKDKELMNKVFEDINENKILAELQKEYDVFNLLTYNEYDVNEKLQYNPFHTEQFRLLSRDEKSKLLELNNQLEAKRSEIYRYYKEESGLSLNKSEIEKYYLPGNEEIQDLKRKIAEQETRVEFFDALYEAFKNQGWQMKQFLQNLREGY
mgnify:CR=1 FL=1